MPPWPRMPSTRYPPTLVPFWSTPEAMRQLLQTGIDDERPARWDLESSDLEAIAGLLGVHDVADFRDVADRRVVELHDCVAEPQACAVGGRAGVSPFHEQEVRSRVDRDQGPAEVA